jgi:predicted ATPase
MLDSIHRPDFSGTTFLAGGDEGSLVSALTEIQSFLGEPNSEPEELLNPTLFGRERNQELLVAALERRYTYTCSEFVSLVGTSGCGKTSLAESLRPEAAQRHAYFAMGKFPQFTWSNIPYSAIVEAVTNLIDAVLEREDDLENSRRAVRSALGDNIYLLTPLITNLAQLAGIIGFEASATNGLTFAFDRVKLSFS